MSSTKGWLRRAWLGAFALLLLLLTGPQVLAHFGPLPISLLGIAPPEVPGLVAGPDPIVVDEAKAVALGKALFWDVNVGSDGVACASCHFHAGADRRVKNQLSPSGSNPGVPAPYFDLSPMGQMRGPNYRLGPHDFPFHQTSDPLNPNATVLYSSDDVTSSAGGFGGTFASVSQSDSNDDCLRQPDGLFHVGGVGVRQVIARNAPTVINAVYSFRQFWDGAGNNIFNGSSAWGDRDPDAGVWVVTSPGVVEKQRLELINSSLASQALMPPRSSREMSCEGRGFAGHRKEAGLARAARDPGRALGGRGPRLARPQHAGQSPAGARHHLLRPRDAGFRPEVLVSPGNGPV